MPGKPRLSRPALLLLAAAAWLPGAVAAEDLSLLPRAVGLGDVQHSDAGTGLALAGWDPVSYLVAPGPRPGEAGLEAVWAGAAWRFASAANRAAFLADPDSFAPRLGGHDALALEAGRLVPGDPRLFALVDGRLYLFRDAARRDAFLGSPHGAADAERAWTAMQADLVRG